MNALNDVRSGRTLEGVPDILWTTKFAVDCAPLKNVYAELGTTFASSAITFPTVCAHILGTLVKFMGEDRIVFGSDSVWYGSPQWQVESLIPESLKKLMEFPGFTTAEDSLTKLRKEYLALGGQRSNARYGWIRTDV